MQKINWFCGSDKVNEHELASNLKQSVEWKGGRCDFCWDKHLMDEKQIKQLKAEGKNETKEWEIDGFFFI